LFYFVVVAAVRKTRLPVPNEKRKPSSTTCFLRAPLFSSIKQRAVREKKQTAGREKKQTKNRGRETAFCKERDAIFNLERKNQKDTKERKKRKPLLLFFLSPRKQKKQQ